MSTIEHACPACGRLLILASTDRQFRDHGTYTDRSRAVEVVCEGSGRPVPKKSSFRLDERRSPTGTCWGFEDGLDGFDIHAPRCPRAGWSWTHGSGCIDWATWRGPWPDWARR
jgi:hypothetical protein